MALDMEAVYRERIKDLEVELLDAKEHSPMWLKIKRDIRMQESFIRDVQQMKKWGAKF